MSESPYKWIQDAVEKRPQIKYPFRAIINGEICTVWPDWIEHEETYEDGHYDPADEFSELDI